MWPSRYTVVKRLKHGRSDIWGRPTAVRRLARVTKALGARLRELRLDAGLTQERAAEAAGISPNHLGVIENGRVSNTSLASLVGLAMAYKVDLGALFQPEAARLVTARRPRRRRTTPEVRSMRRPPRER